jgi:hypothetical protein
LLPRAALAWLLFACLGHAPVAQADAGPRAASDFHRRAVLHGQVEARGPHAVPLSEEAIAALKRGGELRVFDSAGREVPSLVHSAVSHGEVIERPANIFNRAFRENGIQSLSVEISERNPQPVNEFVFEIANSQYNARVRVEASEDGQQWQILRDGLHLIRHEIETQDITYQHNVLRIPTARFPFYRFELRSALPAEESGDVLEEALDIETVAVRQVVRRGSSLSLRAEPVRYQDARDEDSRHHYYRIDLGREKLGIDQLSFTLDGADFARSASLWEWSPERQRRTRRLASTVAFRYGDDSHSQFDGFTTDARVLALMIDQGDDKPVTVTSVRASRPRQQVRFIAPNTHRAPLALYFEPDEPRVPRYDLARRLREHEVTRFAELEMGPLEDNPGYSKPPEPRSETVPYLLYVVVVPLIIGLCWYVFRTLQQAPSREDSPPS